MVPLEPSSGDILTPAVISVAFLLAMSFIGSTVFAKKVSVQRSQRGTDIMGKIRISIGNDFFFFAVLRMLPAFGSQVFIQEICQFPDTSEIYVF